MPLTTFGDGERRRPVDTASHANESQWADSVGAKSSRLIGKRTLTLTSHAVLYCPSALRQGRGVTTILTVIAPDKHEVAF